MKTAAMSDRPTHTLDVAVYHVINMEILCGFCYTKDLTKKLVRDGENRGTLDTRCKRLDCGCL